MSLTSTNAGIISGFNVAARDALLAELGESEVVTSGALNLSKPIHDLSVTGTVAYTLAAGTTAGQRKRITCTVAADTPAGTLTITSPEDTAGLVCATTWLFNTVGQSIELVWTGTKWRCTRVQAAGRDTPTAATTLNVLVALHNPTITGTQDWIIPSGSCVGQRQMVVVASAGSLPAGTISGLFYDEDGSADGTDVVMDAAADTAVLEWNGVRWMPVYLVSATIS
jgi:hypothetical protein